MFKLYQAHELTHEILKSSDQGYCFVFVKKSDDIKSLKVLGNIIYVTEDNDLLQQLSGLGLGVIALAGFELININEAKKLETLKNVGKNIDQLSSSVAQNVFRYKKLYERLSPLRKEQFRNTFISFKYAAGLSAGGEFFDFHDLGENRIVLFHSSSDSYVFSSVALENFDKWKSRLTDREEVKKFMQMQLDEANKINSNVVLSIFYIDTKAQDVIFYSNKKQDLYKNRDAISIETTDLNEGTQLHLKLHERLIFLSLGVYKNASDISGTLPALLQKKTSDLLPEIFFRLKKTDIDDFLKSDASVIVFEIGAEGKV